MLSERVEEELADILAAYDLACELYSTTWVRQRVLIDITGLSSGIVYERMNMLVICMEFERYSVSGAHVRYKWIGGGA